MQFPLFDVSVVNWLNHHLIPGSVPALRIISYSTTYISIALVLIVLVISIIKRSEPIRKKFFILAAVLILVSLVSQGLKTVINRERPFNTYHFIEKLSEGGDSSFPSGHTMEAFALAASLSLMFPRKKVVIPVYVWAVVVAYTRMALGVHYPSDVLGGIVIGTLMGWGIPWIINRLVPGGGKNILT